MKTTSPIFLAVLLASAAPAAAQYEAPPQASGTAAASAEQKSVKPSSKALKSIIALNNAVQANDIAAIAKALPEAKAAASTKEDHYLIGTLEMKAALAANDNAAIASAIDQIARSNYLSPREMAVIYTGQGGSFYTAKQFDAAATAFERGLALDPANVELLTNLGETRFAQGRGAEAVTYLQRAIVASTAAGTKAEEAFYKRAVGIAYASKLPSAIDLSRDWVAAYPNADSWHNALAIYQNTRKPDLPVAIEVYRLMQATKSLSNLDDYMLYSSSAYDLANYVEARAAIDAGLAAGTITATSPGIKDLVVALKAKPATTLATLDVASREVKDASGRLRVGDRYLAMGEYAKAIALYREADGKPGIDQNELKMHLGMALVRSGDKTGAAAAFAAVQGKLQPIAAYWQLYVKQLG